MTTRSSTRRSARSENSLVALFPSEAAGSRRGAGGPKADVKVPTCYAPGYERARHVDPEMAEAYLRHTTVGDPAADAVIADLETLQADEWHSTIAKALLDHQDVPEGTPASLRRLVEEAAVVPDWYDRDLAWRAGRGLIRNAEIVLIALTAGAIVEGFGTLISKPFRIRGRVMQNGVKRLKQNLIQLVEQFMPGGVEPGSDGWRLTLRTRLVHARVRRLMRTASGPEVGELDGWDEDVYGCPLSAAHMLLGAAAFSARLMEHAAALGGDFTPDEREGYVHVWRYTARTLGVPDAIAFEDQSAALRAFRIGALCEPRPDFDAVIMTNTIINSAPLVLGFTEPARRRKEAARLHQVSRELIGDEAADGFRYPKPLRMRLLPLLRLKHWAVREGRRRLGAWRRAHGRESFRLLLRVSDLQRYEHSYSLPTTLHEEDSRRW